jgi:hypothetical protein
MTCQHENTPVPLFDKDAAAGLQPKEVRERWPRGVGPCPDCGDTVIVYANWVHYVYGDWYNRFDDIRALRTDWDDRRITSVR